MEKADQLLIGRDTRRSGPMLAAALAAGAASEGAQVVDLGVVPSLIRRHENLAGRRLSVVARLDARPGGLATLLSVFADGGADLIEVEHIREGLDLHVRETGIHATFEVRGAEHAQRLLESARVAGYDVVESGI